jgi:hypothetical protein
MRHWCLLPLAAVAALWAQDPAARPEPRERARALLDSAAGAVAAARPQVQVAGLIHLAGNYQVFDRTRALDLYRQAFTVAAALPPSATADPRGALQAEIVRQVATLDLSAAIALLARMEPASGTDADPRETALAAIVNQLLGQRQYDQALAAVEAAGAVGAYPYAVLGTVLERLPADDARRVTAFGAAMAAFANRPGTEFAGLLVRAWKGLPPPVAQSAADSFVAWVLDRADAGYTAASRSTARGSVTFSTRQEAELFDVMYVVQQVDPDRAAALLARYPALAAALAKFPQGTASMLLAGGGLNTAVTRSRKKPTGESEAAQRLNALAESRAAAVLTWVGTDNQKALDLVPTIPLVAKQAEVTAAIGRALVARDPAAGAAVLERAASLLDKVKEPAQRIRTWETVAEAAHQAGDDQLAWQALERGLSDAAGMYRLDTDAGDPNQALVEYWPSTQAYRRLVAVAARAFGVAAEPLLAGIGDVDVALLARIELAQALLGRAPSTVPAATIRLK